MRPIRTIAVTMQNGDIAIMQMFADRDAEAEIRRSVMASPPVSFVEITPEQADAIRAARPKPQPAPAVVAPELGSAITPELAQAILDMAGKLAALEGEVATHRRALAAIETAAVEEARGG